MMLQLVELVKKQQSLLLAKTGACLVIFGLDSVPALCVFRHDYEWSGFCVDQSHHRPLYAVLVFCETEELQGLASHSQSPGAALLFLMVFFFLHLTMLWTFFPSQY